MNDGLFLLDLLWRTFNSAVASLGTTVFGIIFGIVIGVAYTALRLKRKGRGALTEHWREDLQHFLVATGIAWVLLLGYSLVYITRDISERALAAARRLPVRSMLTPAAPAFALAFDRRHSQKTLAKSPTFTESESFYVLIGSNDYRVSMESTKKEPSEIRLYGEPRASIRAYVEGGKIYVDTLLDIGAGKEPLKLVHNDLRNRPPRWDRNYDNSAIEIVDESLVPRFQLIYKDRMTAQLCGVFRFQDRAVVINSHNVHYFAGSYESDNDIRRVFEYPSRLHAGEELNTSPVKGSANDRFDLYGQCEATLLPTTINGKLYELQLRAIPAERGGGGLDEVLKFGEVRWPTQESGAPVSAYKCNIINYGSATVVHISLSLHLTFKEAINTGNGEYRSGKVTVDRDWPIQVGKIDPGVSNAFTFYIDNWRSNQWVLASLPDNATLEIFGDSSRRTVHVTHPDANVMPFGPFIAAKDGH